MKSRRKSRELALQIVYSFQTNKKSIEKVFEDAFFKNSTLKVREYASILINGILNNKKEVDKVISSYSKNWKISRIPLIDHIILQIAIYEIIYSEDVPAVVGINEAIELTKKFSTPDSKKFVNGILDKFYKDHINNG